MFERNVLTEMFQVQNDLNRVMGGNAWLQSDNSTRPYYRAAWVEGGEAVSGFGYKWWKLFDRSANIGQVKLEVVDMLHFVLSDELRATAISWANDEQMAPRLTVDAEGLLTDGCVQELIEETVDRVIRGGVIDLPDDMGEETFIHVTEQFVGNAILRKRVQIRNWAAMADALNMTMAEAGLWYLGKAALNMLRDRNGQKEGTYVKTWWGKEDNVFLEAFLNVLRSAPAPESIYDAIFNHMSEQYRRLMEGEPALVV